VLSHRLSENHCRDLPELQEDVPLEVRARMWYVHDGAPAHFSGAVQNVPNNTYNDRRVGRGGPTTWTSASRDLNPLTFYLW
jgi:hypothetical protein